MKVLHVSTYFLPVIGGLENVVHNLSKALLERGHEVHVLTSNLTLTQDKIDVAQETIDGLHVTRTPCTKLRYGLEYPRDLNTFAFEGFDVVHLHAHLSPFYLSAARRAKGAGTPVLTHFMAVDGVRTHRNPGVKFFGSLFENYALKTYKNLIDVALAKSEVDYEKLTGLYGFPNVEMLPDGCPASCFERHDEEIFRNKFGVSSDDTILFLGRIHPLKGIDVLIKAAELVVEDHPGACFVIAGPDDGMMAEITQTIDALGLRGNVKVTGFLSEEEKLSALSACRMLVVPSLSDIVEVYSTVISEAFAQRKPVIASEIGGLSARVDEGRNGFLVRPYDHEQLAQRIKQLLTDKELAERMGEQGALQVHSWGEV
ncbi:MAG: glycosyltransferase family 4 protein, partial [Candidatus Bathyarchaeia archaeon]